MKNRISTGALFAMLMLMAMLPRTGHSQEIDPNAYYEIVSSIFNDPATPEIYTLSLHDALPFFSLAAFGGR